MNTSTLDSIKRLFELDLRSLAVARIFLAFFILLDCLFRLQNFEAHYSDYGVLPLDFLYNFYTPKGPCLHCLTANDSWIYFIFALHMIAALLMMLGWKTRWSIFFTWLFTISIQYRNPLIIDGGDVLMRCFLLWFFFLPVGEFFSLDAKNKKITATQTMWWLNPMLGLQLFMVYFFSALLKTGEEWWPLGTATGFALSLEAFVTPFGKWLTQFPEGLKIMSRLVYLVELWAPFLLLMWGKYRLVGMFIFMGFHAGLGLSMDLALFPWIAFACLFSLAPREFWDFFRKNSLPKTFPVPKLQAALSVLALPYFLIAITWNVLGLMKIPVPKPILRTGQWIHVDQYWGMFAPYPLKDSGWYEFGLHLWNGQYVYTFIDKQMEAQWNDKEARPTYGNLYFIDQRWRKYLITIWDKKNSKYRPALANYLCRKWNREHPQPSNQALKLDMEFLLIKNREYLETSREPASVKLGTFNCKEEEMQSSD